MNWRLIAALGAGLVVASCGGNPLGNEPDCGGNPFAGCADGGSGSGGGSGGGGTPGEPIPPSPGEQIPQELSGNLRSVTYTAASGTLNVQIDPLGTGGRQLPFVRTPSLDTAGFQAFTYQATDSNRYYVALFDTSASGSVTAGVAGSGQFTEMVWGSAYSADVAFSRPTTGPGLATYSGNYAGLINSGSAQNPSPPPGAPAEPVQSLRTTGEVVINADFNAPAITGQRTGVEGVIRGRQIVDNGVALDDVFLQITAINADGSFGGTVTFRDRTNIGSYAGSFGGAGGDAVAGAIEIAPISGAAETLERGAFVADRCTPGQASPCPTTP